jgi:hypothetical protein
MAFFNMSLQNRVNEWTKDDFHRVEQRKFSVKSGASLKGVSAGLPNSNEQRISMKNLRGIGLSEK